MKGEDEDVLTVLLRCFITMLWYVVSCSTVSTLSCPGRANEAWSADIPEVNVVCEEKGKEEEIRKREDNNKELAACAYLCGFNCHGDIRMAVASVQNKWKVLFAIRKRISLSYTLPKQLSWYGEHCHSRSLSWHLFKRL
jgi:hypothetical protein